MGTSGGNGGGWPPDNGPPDDLPELPPEWQGLVVPDDPAALAEEASLVRAELDRQRRRDHRRSGRRYGPEVRIASLVLAVSVLVTLASVLAATWPGKPRPSVAPRGTPTASSAGATGRDLPALELVDAEGGTVALRAALPAVILLVDGCACGDLVASTARARPDLTVVTVTAGRAAPGFSPPTGTPAPVRGPGVPIRHLTDPTGELRGSLGLGAPDGTAAAVLVSATGRIGRLVPSTTSVADFQTDLAAL